MSSFSWLRINRKIVAGSQVLALIDRTTLAAGLIHWHTGLWRTEIKYGEMECCIFPPEVLLVLFFPCFLFKEAMKPSGPRACANVTQSALYCLQHRQTCLLLPPQSPSSQLQSFLWSVQPRDFFYKWGRAYRESDVSKSCCLIGETQHKMKIWIPC